MSSEYSYRNFAKDLLNGLSFLRNKALLLIFVLMFLSIFALNYLGLFSTFGLSPHLSLANIRTPETQSDANLYLSLFVISVFITIFLLELELYIKKGHDKRTKTIDMLKSAARNYPRFFVATFFKYLVAIGGLILLVVPGLILGPLYIFMDSSTVYKGANFFEASKFSRDSAKSHFTKALLLFLIFIAILLLVLYIVVTAFSDLGIGYRYLIGSILLSYVIMSFTAACFEVFYSIQITSSGDHSRLAVAKNQ